MFFLFLILLDQLTKYLIRYFGGFYICNTGISFGIRMSHILFWILWAALIAILSYLAFKTSGSKAKKIESFGIALMLGGAVSNAIDRFFFDCVIDFIDLGIWPVFNLADIFITIGAIIIMSVIFKNKS